MLTQILFQRKVVFIIMILLCSNVYSQHKSIPDSLLSGLISIENIGTKHLIKGQNIITFTSIGNSANNYDFYLNNEKINSENGICKFFVDTLTSTYLDIKLKSDSSIILKDQLLSFNNKGTIQTGEFRQNFIQTKNAHILNKNKINELKLWNYSMDKHYYKISNVRNVTFNNNIIQFTPKTGKIVQLEFFLIKNNEPIGSSQFIVR